MIKETKAKFTGYVKKIIQYQGLFDSGCSHELHLSHVISEDWKARLSNYTIVLADKLYPGSLSIDSKVEFDAVYSVSSAGIVTIRYPRNVKKLY
jgi:hypothetical protein